MKMDKKVLFGTIVLCILSCKVVSMPGQESRSNSPRKAGLQYSEEPSVPILASDTSEVTLTEMTASISTKNSLTPTYKYVKLNTLPSGRYIIYTVITKITNEIFHFIVSENGQEMGSLLLEAGAPYISRDQSLIAFVGNKDIKLFRIKQNTINTLQIDDEYFWGSGELAWGPASDMLALTSSSSINIFTIENGMKVGEISQQKSNIMPINPKWSPNGKWIAYYILSGEMESPPSPGPYVTETSCMINPEECKDKTKLIVNAEDQLIDWTPENDLAVFDKYNKIRIYDILSSSLVKEIQIPNEIGYAEYFSWSNDEEWIAFGGTCGVCIMSIITGETKVLSTKGYMVDFWYIVP
jgi:WD40 repeat protein